MNKYGDFFSRCENTQRYGTESFLQEPTALPLAVVPGRPLPRAALKGIAGAAELTVCFRGKKGFDGGEFSSQSESDMATITMIVIDKDSR